MIEMTSKLIDKPDENDVILASIYDRQQGIFSIPLTLYEACNILANQEVDIDDLKKLDIYVVGVIDVKTGDLKTDKFNKYLFMSGEDFISKRKEKDEVKPNEI